MRFNDALFGAVLIIFAVAVIGYAQTFPSLYGQSYGPDLFPVIIALGMIGCGVVLVVRGVAQRTTSPMVVLGDWAQDRANLINVALLLGSVVFYIFASGTLGFIPVSLLIMTVLLARLGSSWPVSIAVAVATTLIIHTLFAKLLLVPLPWGLLQPVAW